MVFQWRQTGVGRLCRWHDAFVTGVIHLAGCFDQLLDLTLELVDTGTLILPAQRAKHRRCRKQLNLELAHRNHRLIGVGCRNDLRFRLGEGHSRVSDHACRLRIEFRHLRVLTAHKQDTANLRIKALNQSVVELFRITPRLIQRLSRCGT
ncbi:hypothetical protein [Mycobacteroides abscessus]|uniref:hypothetical protein n=1 Tax=Mycobacteroides abscessus TaxID=36809 RepID=UPI001F3A6A93|nr:hypothetical protein [Mycobacteroides abscessus]